MFSLSKIHHLSIAKRLAIIIISALLGIAILTADVLISERTMITEERQNAVKQTVEVAHSIVGQYHALAAQGKLSEAQAKQSAIAAIKAIRYGADDYVWINDLHPNMVMHPMKPALDGKDLT